LEKIKNETLFLISEAAFLTFSIGSVKVSLICSKKLEDSSSSSDSSPESSSIWSVEEEEEDNLRNK